MTLFERLNRGVPPLTCFRVRVRVTLGLELGLEFCVNPSHPAVLSTPAKIWALTVFRPPSGLLSVVGSPRVICLDR